MIKCFLEIDRYDNKRNLLEHRKVPMRSFVQQTLGLLYILMSNGAQSVTDISNTSRTPSNWVVNGLLINSPGGDSGLIIPAGTAAWGSAFCVGYTYQCGIVVGSGSPTPAPQDYKLVTQIAHGSGAGQLLYGGCEVFLPTFADPNGLSVIRRYFTNSSGGDVPVNESGIYSAAQAGDPGSGIGTIWPFCLAHDAVSPGVVVANTQILAVTYTVQITV